MAELSTDVRIFLSSTFVDLQELREEIARRLRDVFGAHLLVMETFGSDAAPPVISAIRHVRECDIFVGIYARRYGAVDPATGKSITELELDEAERSLSAGALTDILLYWLDDDANWPPLLCETDGAAIMRLKAFREHSHQHTYTPFRDPRDLPYFVIRDVLAKLRHRLVPPSLRTRQLVLPNARKLQRPIGMEFLTSADREHFYGRETKLKELLDAIESNRITLLLGNSGTGKTSLIHAGLIPEAISVDWFPVYTRPLGLPRADVVAGLVSTVFEGPQSYRGTLLGALDDAAEAVAPKRVLLIIDQFEDILSARENREAERLIDDLRALRFIDDPRVRVLLAYRADLEARLGVFWQSISGSPAGLPRVYVSGISAEEAWKSVWSTCADLSTALDLSESEGDQIRKDLQAFSARQEPEKAVYPPYLQMFIDHVWRSLGNQPGSYRFDRYLAAGAMEGVTAGYLSRQLQYAQDNEGHLKAVLVSLVRSYGVKAQKTLAEIAADTGLSSNNCEVALEKLIDLRLVRHLDGLYEIAHDFLAREVAAKLVDAEEREFKRIRELLTSKAASYGTTYSLLSVEELLLMFKHRQRILLSDEEVGLTIASWVEGKGPGLSLLLTAPSTRLVELIRSQEPKGGSEEEGKAMLILLRSKVTTVPLEERDWAEFRSYQLGMEVAEMITASPLACPDRILLWAARNRRLVVAEAAFQAITKKVAAGQTAWIGALGKSSSKSYRSEYERLAIDQALPLCPDDPAEARPIREFALLQRIARAANPETARALMRELKAVRPSARVQLFASGIAGNRIAGIAATVKRLGHLGAEKTVSLLNSISSPVTEPEMQSLLNGYRSWNQKEAGLTESSDKRVVRVYEEKAVAFAKSILRVSTEQNLAALRSTFGEITLTSSAQYLAIALVRHGDAGDVIRLIERIGGAEHRIPYWFQIEVGRAVGRRMRSLRSSMPAELLRIYENNEFWRDPRATSLANRRSKLPLKNIYNRALYVRIVANALIGSAGKNELNLLQALAQHEYRLVARAAAVRLAQFGDEGMAMLQSSVTEAIEHQGAENFGLAVRDAEIERFGLIELW
jgi:hypothetical protein